MKHKFISLILLIIFTFSPLLVCADGKVIRPLPNGDWVLVEEERQQAFINYEQGIEKLIIAVDLKEEHLDAVWIVPIPGDSGDISIDITPELPIFFGDEVMSKAKINFVESIKNSYQIGLFGQIWTLPLAIVTLSLRGASVGGGGEMASGDFVSIEARIEKQGMIAELITAKDGTAIYNYLSQKGFKIEQGSISQFDSYIEQNYSFVVSWISPEAKEQELTGQRGIFISFPSPKIYYPLILTSAYGELEIPITIRVLGHVKPDLYKDIKNYTKIDYFIAREKALRGAREARAKSALIIMWTTLEMFYADYGRYPFSLQELLESKHGDEAQVLINDIQTTTQTTPLYFSENREDYIMRIPLSSGLFEIDSLGFIGYVDKQYFDPNKGIPPELQAFYGKTMPWSGSADYTKITINAPAKLLTQDLWMTPGRPLKITLALWSIKSPITVQIILYLLLVGIISFIAGGLAGLYCFRKFKKYAFLGLSNIFTLTGLIFAYLIIKRKSKDIYYSKINFILSFTLIFVLLLIALLALPLIVSIIL